MSRYFPGDDRRRFVALAAAVLVGLALLVSPLASADDLKDKQREVERQLTEAHEDLDESSAALREATIKLREAQAKLDQAREKLSETRGELTVAKARDKAAQEALVQAERDLEKAQDELRAGEVAVVTKGEQVGDQVASIYEKGDPRLATFSALLNATDPDDVTRSIAASDAILDTENAVLAELEAAKILLTVKEERVAAEKVRVEKMREEAAANLQHMERLEARAAQEEASVASLVADASSAESAAQKVRDRDAAELKKLEQEEAKIKEMLRKRAEEAARKAREKENANTPPKSSGGFLSYPVSGRVTSSFGYRVHPIYGYYSLHDGTDFGAACGQPLFAAADGVVVSRYFQTAWGNRLIIDHGYQRGKGVATIYNHATHYTVSVGSNVKRGQVVGYVGTTGWSTGCHLHFTVMANGSPVNPMGWL